MKYLIHDASQLVGIAPQTIRYYEKLGIISESRDKYSGYRFFDTLDISILMRSRNYRGYGFDLKETAEMMNEKKLDEIITALRERERVLDKEIAWARHLRLHLRNYITQLEEAEASNGCFRLVDRPALFGLVYRNNKGISTEPKLRKQLKNWMRYMPLPQPLVAYNADREKNTEEWFKHGFCITPQDAKMLHIDINEYVFYLEPVPCVYSVSKLPCRDEMSHEYISALIKKTKKEGLVISGTIYGRVLISINKSAEHFVYIEYWVPYKK